MRRRQILKFICSGSTLIIGSTILGEFYIKKTAAKIPFLKLVKVSILLLDIVDKSLNIGEKLRGLFKLDNNTNKKQSGKIIINIFNSSNLSTPETTITKNVEIPPKTQKTYQLPSIQVNSPGKKILQLRTELNSLSTSFRYGSFCCDSRGNRRCPVPYSLNLGTECLCSGQGVGIICE